MIWGYHYFWKHPTCFQHLKKAGKHVDNYFCKYMFSLMMSIKHVALGWLEKSMLIFHIPQNFDFIGGESWVSSRDQIRKKSPYITNTHPRRRDPPQDLQDLQDRLGGEICCFKICSLRLANSSMPGKKTHIYRSLHVFIVVATEYIFWIVKLPHLFKFFLKTNNLDFRDSVMTWICSPKFLLPNGALIWRFSSHAKKQKISFNKQLGIFKSTDRRVGILT